VLTNKTKCATMVHVIVLKYVRDAPYTPILTEAQLSAQATCV